MSNASLHAARLHSLAVLVVVYVGLSFSAAHHQRLSQLWHGRQAMALILLDEQQTGFVSGLGDVTASSQPTSAEDNIQTRVTIARDSNRSAVSVSDTQRASYDDLRTVALAFEIEDVPTTDTEFQNEYVRIYRQIEAKAGAGLDVPGTGLRFLGANAVWACALFVAALLVIMRDRIQHVLLDPDLARGERWLAVDGRTGLERVMALLEIGGLLFGPSTLVGGLFLVIASQIIADSANSSPAGDVFNGVLSLALFIVNAWLSISTVAHVLELRRLRREAPPPMKSASPAAPRVA